MHDWMAVLHSAAWPASDPCGQHYQSNRTAKGKPHHWTIVQPFGVAMKNCKFSDMGRPISSVQTKDTHNTQREDQQKTLTPMNAIFFLHLIR